MSTKPGTHRIRYAGTGAFASRLPATPDSPPDRQLRPVIVGSGDSAEDLVQPNFNIQANTDGNCTITYYDGHNLVVEEDKLFASPEPRDAEAWRFVSQGQGTSRFT